LNLASLLSTKLYIPRGRASLVSRNRLTERLRQGLTGPLTLVSAPPGYGKTTLVSESVNGIHQPVAWLSLDEGDSDPVRFGTYFVAALQTLCPGLGEEALALFQSPQPPPLETALAPLINEIARVLPDLVFVLDDYHVISAQGVHTALAFLLDHLPPQMHLVIASRADLPLPLGRLRVRGQLMELRADDLRFTPDEAAAFLELVGLRLDPGDVAALEARTEGWIAGLQLASLSMQGRDDVHEFVAAFAGSNRFVLDYLTEEVLKQQPEPIQTFLLQTCILERLSGALCAALTGRPDSQGLLEALDRANMFLTALDDQRGWFRYHRLFADLLRFRLQQNQPELALELHGRAAVWLRQNGLLAEAVPHALQAQAFDLAAELIDAQAEELLMRGETATLAQWGRALPAAALAIRPPLSLYLASALLIGGDIEAGRQLLDLAEAALARPDAGLPAHDLRTLQGRADAIRSIVVVALGDLNLAIELSQRALERLSAGDRLWRNVASIGLANSYRTMGKIDAAGRIYADIAADCEANGDYYTALLAAFAHGSSLEEAAHLRQAEAVYQRSLLLARRQTPGPAEGLALAGLAGLSYEWNDLETAWRQTETALELGHRGRIADILTNGYVTLVRLQLAQGDAAAALKTADQLLELATAAGFRAQIAATKAFQAYLWLQQGNLAAVAEWVRGYQPPPFPLHSSYELEAQMLARALLAIGRHDESLALIRKLRADAAAIGRQQSVMEFWKLEALAQQARGDEQAALTALEQALALAEPEGYVRSFVDDGEPLRLLLADFAHGTRPAQATPQIMSYVGKLLSAFPALGLPAQPTIESIRPSPEALADPLSDRELEVLRLIAANRSNLEIADTLIVSVNTVKTHINRLYVKLDAHNRLEAVERARDLHLL
jgi:LuxR family maltose regulon positive regulatory protein